MPPARRSSRVPRVSWTESWRSTAFLESGRAGSGAWRHGLDATLMAQPHRQKPGIATFETILLAARVDPARSARGRPFGSGGFGPHPSEPRLPPVCRYALVLPHSKLQRRGIERGLRGRGHPGALGRRGEEAPRHLCRALRRLALSRVLHGRRAGQRGVRLLSLGAVPTIWAAFGTASRMSIAFMASSARAIIADRIDAKAGNSRLCRC